MAVSDRTHRLLLAAFRERPGVYSHAGRQAGVDRDTAKRAWLQGWPNERPARPAIKDLFAEEEKLGTQRGEDVRAEVRAEVASYAAALRADTRDDALDVHGVEGRLVKTARTNATNLLSVAARLPRSLATVAAQIAEQLDKADNGLTLEKKLDTLNRAAAVIEKAVKVGQTVLEMERLFRGDPTKVIGVVPMEEMSVEEARRLALEAYEAAQRYERNGLEVIEGGAQQDAGPTIPVQATP